MKIETQGADRAKRMIEAAIARAQNLQPVLEIAAQDLRTLVDDSFQNSVSPGGTPWRPLKPATVAARRQGSDKPLVDTARLRNSITVRVTRQAVALGTNVIYAGTHLFGRGRIPARPFMPISSEIARGPARDMITRIVARVKKYIADGTIG